MIGSFVTMHARLAVREVAKVFGVPPGEVNHFTRRLPHRPVREILEAIRVLPQCRALPAAEDMLAACLHAIRTVQAQRPAEKRFDTNRILMYVWPPSELTTDEMTMLTQRVLPTTAGAGLEEVTFLARQRRSSGELTDMAVRISLDAGNGVRLHIEEPSAEPVQPLDDYRQKVLRAALDFVDANGLAALSMHKLGAELGVQGMSLYSHVASKDALLDGIVEAMTWEAEMPPADGTDWRDALRHLAGEIRGIILRHPAAAPRSSGTTLRDSRTRSESVRTFMPSSAFREHAGASTRAPSSSTTHTRHTFSGVRFSRKHSVGVSMPRRRAASRIVPPSGTVTFLPSI